MRATILLPTLTLLLTLAPLSGRAATLIESRSGDGTVNRIWIDTGGMRIDVGDAPEYMLVDTKAGRMYSVNAAAKTVMDLTPAAPEKRVRPPDVGMTFERKGEGPVIAGFATVHYVLSAGGKKCGEEYLSKEAMAAVGDYEVLRKVDEISSAGLGEAEMAEMDPCAIAFLGIDREYAEKGFPVRIVDPDGGLRTELVRIDGKASPPPPGLVIPAEYRSVDLEMLMEGGEGAPPAASPADIEELQRMLEELRKGASSPDQ